jgi:hypothetical protein
VSGTASGVRPEQRFTEDRPCPICGGHDRMGRGKGERCYGFLSTDGEWARCTREEYAGTLQRESDTDAFPHKLTGDCRCGARHCLGAGERNDHARKRKKPKGRIAETHDYLDERGEFLYQVVRLEPKSFRQRRPDGEGSWIWNLEGIRRVPYRLPELLEADQDETVFVFEGEGDVDLARDDGLVATTNAGGAGKWRPEYSEHLRGRPVVVVPDNDKPGRKHGEQVARSTYSKAASLKVLHLPGLPEGGDYSEWRERGGTAQKLRRLAREEPEWTPPEERDDGRVMLEQLLREGVEPPAELVPDLLLEGKAHSIYGGPELGKTFIMLWLILRVLERGAPVLLYDKENGTRLIVERLQQLGADPERTGRLLHYYPDASLPTTEEGRLAFEEKLDRVKPALACFDSWIGFLASNGLDENSSNDVASFAANYIHPARSRGIATLLLDHVPHEGNHARGSTRKKDELDVVWSLHRLQKFDRESVGRVFLKREKDREGWLLREVGFSIGGDGRGGFVCARSAGTFETEGSDGLKPSERKTLEALRTFGQKGAIAKDWRKAAEKLDVGERSFWNAVRTLKEKECVLQENKTYIASTAKNCTSTAIHRNAVDPNATATTAPPLRGAVDCSTGASEEPDDDFDGLEDLFADDTGGVE